MNFFERRRQRKNLEKSLANYVAPEAASKILQNPDLLKPSFSQSRIDFLFILLRERNPEKLSSLIAAVTELAHDNGAVVLHILGPLVVLTIGIARPVPNSAKVRSEILAALCLSLGADAKIVHGQTEASSGNFGAPTRMTFTVVFPSFDAVLATLARLPYDKVAEFPGEPVEE